MTRIVILLLTFYQVIISPLIKQVLGLGFLCRYPVSCSEFAKHSVKRYGFFQGSILAIRRFLSCQPFARYDRNAF